MSYLIDTSVLIRTVHTSSQYQQVSLEAISKLRQDDETLHIVPQNLIEFWVVATRPAESNGLDLTVSQTKVKIEHLKKVFILQAENQHIFDLWEELVSKY